MLNIKRWFYAVFILVALFFEGPLRAGLLFNPIKGPLPTGLHHAPELNNQPLIEHQILSAKPNLLLTEVLAFELKMQNYINSQV